MNKEQTTMVQSHLQPLQGQEMPVPHPQIVVRIAGLPLDTFQKLRFDRSTQLIEKLHDLAGWLTSQALPLSEALHPCIGALAEEEKHLRSRLISLRRAIFQGKPPKPQDCSVEVLAALPISVREAVCLWLQQVNCQQEYLHQAEQTFALELAEKREMLLLLSQQEAFLQGLLLASKDLYLDLLRFLEAVPKRSLDRRLEQGLISYLARMAAKTSPYSTFTASALGVWDNDSPDALSYQAPWSRQSVIELSDMLVHQIATELATWPEVRPYLTLHINPTLEQNARSLDILSQRNHGREVVTRLVTSPSLQTILHLLRTAPDRTYGAVLRRLAPSEGEHRSGRVAQFLDQLIEKGLLQLAYDIPDQSPDYLGELVQKLKAISSSEERVRAIVTRLTTIHASLAQYALLGQAHTRFEMLAQIRQSLEEVYTQIGLSQKPGYQLPAKNIFFENAFIPDLHMHCSRTQWQAVLTDLDLYQHLAGLYDPLLPGQRALQAFFLERYGNAARVKLLDFYEAFCQARHQKHDAPGHIDGATLHHIFQMPFAPTAFTLDVVSELHTLRQTVTRWLHDQPLDAHHIRQLDPAQLARIIAEFPAYIRKPRSLAYYCQVLLHENQPSLVINSLQSGFGRSSGRLQFVAKQAHALSDNDAANSRHASLWADPLPVSIQGGFGANINLRVDALPYEIAYPGYVSARPLEEQLPFSDLLVVHEPQSQRLLLFSERLQRPLLPVHLGLMADFWMPPMYRFLLQAFSEAPINPVWNSFLLKGAEIAEQQDPEIKHVPRLCLGHLCLSRAHWLLPPRTVPQQDQGESSFHYWLKLQHWREELGLPQQCYIRVNPGPFTREGTETQVPPFETTSKGRKPVYIDFCNYFSARLFEKLATQNNAGLFIEEALPGNEELVFTAGQQAYTSEFIIELTGGR
ncbi:MAG TPA: lantibiotic dehydratase [Ktedonobacteraceae bacterium]|nr:lantibiotic dehydratase [Ktedonobacteraceae bacterium]